MPYSSEANKNSKLNVGDIGVKSNSRIEALIEFIEIPDCNKVLSKLKSPGQLGAPSFSIEVLGPAEWVTSPVLNMTPACIGKFGLVLLKYPIPFDEAKFVPVFQVMFVAETQGELINTVFTN